MRIGRTYAMLPASPNIRFEKKVPMSPRLMKLHKNRNTVTANMTMRMMSLRTAVFSCCEAALCPPPDFDRAPWEPLPDRAEEDVLRFAEERFPDVVFVFRELPDAVFLEELFEEDEDCPFFFPVEVPAIYILPVSHLKAVSRPCGRRNRSLHLPA